GNFYATNFIRYGQMYEVMVQADPHYRQTPEDDVKLLVKAADAEKVPYSSIIQMKRGYGPDQLSRHNLVTSALFIGQPAPGFSTAQAIETIQQLAEELPQGYTIEWAGMTREQVISGNQAVYIFALCLVFVYLLLSAQYESFLLPLPVILGL